MKNLKQVWPFVFVLILLSFVPKKEKETLSQKLEKYDVIPVYVSYYSRLVREPKSSTGESPKKELYEAEIPRDMQDELHKLIVKQLNEGFKTEKFKVYYNPLADMDQWNKSDKTIFMSLEMIGTYKVVTDPKPAKVSYSFRINNYFYEKGEKGVFKKIKSPGSVVGEAKESKEVNFAAGIGLLKNSIKPTVVLEALKKEIETDYPKWVAKQFPEE